MTISFLDLKRSYGEIAGELEEAVVRVLRSGQYIGGQEVEAFEQNFARYVEAEHAIGVANGLEALHLALRAIGIKAGDEVIVPSNTFIATWLAVSQVGARCVPVEPDDGTSNIDPGRIEAAITPATRAIIPVHLYGQAADLDPVLDIARRHDLFVIEDAAQAQGALYKGRRVGAHGHMVIWSFYPGKNLGAIGDAGGVTTNDRTLADRVRLLRNYGSRERYQHLVPGFNSRLDPIQAAALTVKLRHLDNWNDRRRQIAAQYHQGLAGLNLLLPRVLDACVPVWHLYCVRHPQRDALRATLAERGVETLIHYPVPPHLQPAYADQGFRKGQYPIAERMSEELISLPIDPLMRDMEVAMVVDAVKASVTALG